MDDDVISRLEAAIAELGTLLVQMEKFRACRTPEAARLRATSLAIGDRARRAHRHGDLDPALATGLLADAHETRGALDDWLLAVRSSVPYRAAVAALAATDRDAFAASIVQVFDGGAIGAPPPVLYHPVAWQRRGRPRAAAEVADEIAELRTTGLVAENDPAAAGVDPALPAVVLHRAAPPGAPVVLVLSGAARPPWVLTLSVTDDVFVPGERFVTPFAVELLAPDDETSDGWVLDPAALERDLRTALVARAIAIRD